MYGVEEKEEITEYFCSRSRKDYAYEKIIGPSSCPGVGGLLRRGLCRIGGSRRSDPR